LAQIKIAEARLSSQRLIGTPFEEPTAVVRWFGAVQAQDFLGAKWALALRCRDVGSEDIDWAFNSGLFLRTHVMRPTWHFVAADDLRWLLDLTGPRVHQANGHMYRKLELSDAVLGRAGAILADSLEGGRVLTRKEAADIFERAGIAARGLRLAYILMHAELTGLICSGPLRGKQHTYALLEERVPAARALTREEAFVTLTRRYFASHGPATVHDFAWWSGLKVSEAVKVLELISSELESTQIERKTYWLAEPLPDKRDTNETLVHFLPNYDEHVVAYKEHQHSLDPAAVTALRSRKDGPLDVHLVTRSGLIIGGWRRKADQRKATIETDFLVEPDSSEQGAITLSAERYGRFIGLPVVVEKREIDREAGAGSTTA
jgi:hypothetical protein